MTHVGISHIETGRTANPNVLSKRALAAAVGYSVDDIWGNPPARALRAARTKR